MEGKARVLTRSPLFNFEEQMGQTWGSPTDPDPFLNRLSWSYFEQILPHCPAKMLKPNQRRTAPIIVKANICKNPNITVIL
jgi:hypothetical protein